MVTVSLPLSKLVPDESQLRQRIDKTSLQSLATNILARGQLQPLRVRPANADGQHVIVFGHRRFAALQLAGKSHADCIVVDGEPDDATILAEQFAENIHRENISPIDEATAYRKFMALRGIPASQAAKELHVHPSRISRLLPLLDLPVEMQEKIHDSTIPKEIGYYIARIQSDDKRQTLFEQAKEGQLTRDDAARFAKRQERQNSDDAGVSRVSCKLPGGRSLTLSAPSIQLETLIESLEEILRECRKARTQGLDVKTLACVLRDRAGGVA